MVNKYNFQINQNQSINRWVYSEPDLTPFSSTPDTFNEPVNLTEEYVQVEYPVRKQFLQYREELEYPEDHSMFNRIYFPFENPRVEFSTFISTPHTMATFAKTFVEATSKETVHPFILTTCGGVKIWVNGEPQVNFSPFTRNIPTSREVELHLQKGTNEIVVGFDDLAERDVNYYFQLKYMGDYPFEGYISINQPVETVKRAEAYLDSLYFTKDTFASEDIKLASTRNPEIFEKLYVKVNAADMANPVFKSHEGQTNHLKINLNSKHINEINFGKTTNFNTEGLTSFDVGLCIGNGAYIFRKLVVSLYDQDNFPQIKSLNLKNRKQEAINYFATLEKNDLNTGIARLVSKGEFDQKTKTAIYSCFDEISQKKDCADFRLAPLLAIAISRKDYFPKDSLEEIEKIALNFRYWIDEPGNDVMWYFSENHAFLFHVSQYLAGYMVPDKTFKVSGKTGEEQYELGKKRLLEWFDIFFKYGFAEWNSTTYLPIDLIGFYSLYEAAPDNEIKDLAKRALDFTFRIIAINLHGKTMASTYGRVYEHDLKAMETSEIANTTYILWGEGYLNHSLRSTVWFCLSTYNPPELEHLVKLPSNKALLAEYVQGIKQVYSYNYKTKDYSLSSAINFSAYEKGHQQHVMNVSVGEDNTTLWINHPGEYVFSGENRPSFWAGNGRCPSLHQFKNVMTIKYKLLKDDLDFVHAYLPFWKLDQIHKVGNWIFLREGEGYIGMYFNNGYEIKNEKAIAHRELRSYGKNQFILVRCSSKQEIESFDKFIELMQSSSINNKKHEEFSYVDFEHGPIEVNRTDNLIVNGEKIEYKAGYEIKTDFFTIN
ncbi:hypothetical protein LF817_02750 [Halobacillus sp. A1]|uniref:hypothetical protein n=1 Tax=Halobacillus sp. A1 TaxID=2880262 RepID=UPI0020A632AD|nr:hypothetical protein [Halobacillus sp. A1]MCP3030256.1 hypothetical protein [Halobacillus sp. A1]